MREDGKFTTLSLHETSYLFMKGHEYNLEVNPTGRGVFIFHNSKELQNDLVSFRNGANCNIQNYIDALKTVKTDLFGFRVARRGH